MLWQFYLDWQACQQYMCSINDGESTFELQDVIECNSIPSDLPEVATPDVASAHSHLRGIALYLPALEPSKKLELLIGHDIPEIHHVHEQSLGDKGKPFRSKTATRMGDYRKSASGQSECPHRNQFRKTHVLNDGRSTTFPLCEYNIKISDLKDDIFVRTSNDSKVAPSVEDKQFLSLMKSDFQLDDTGYWSAPLKVVQQK